MFVAESRAAGAISYTSGRCSAITEAGLTTGAAIIGRVPAPAILGTAQTAEAFVVAIGGTALVWVDRDCFGATASAKGGLTASSAVVTGRTTIAVLRAARPSGSRIGITGVVVVVAVEEITACIIRGESTAIQEMI